MKLVEIKYQDRTGLVTHYVIGDNQIDVAESAIATMLFDALNAGALQVHIGQPRSLFEGSYDCIKSE